MSQTQVGTQTPQAPRTIEDVICDLEDIIEFSGLPDLMFMLIDIRRGTEPSKAIAEREPLLEVDYLYEADDLFAELREMTDAKA